MTRPVDDEDVEAGACLFCDFSSGTRGMDRCAKCAGTGSGFYADARFFPNTKEGYSAAIDYLKERGVIE